MDRESILIYPIEREGEALSTICEAIYFSTDNYKKFKAEIKIAERDQENRRSCDD